MKTILLRPSLSPAARGQASHPAVVRRRGLGARTMPAALVRRPATGGDGMSGSAGVWLANADATSGSAGVCLGGAAIPTAAHVVGDAVFTGDTRGVPPRGRPV